MSRAAATRAATSADPSAGGGRIRSAGHRRHIDPEIDAVHQRTRDAHLVIRGAAVEPAALAGIAGLIGMAAAAGIHRRDQHEAGRIGDAVVGAGHRDFAVFQWLPQRIEHARIELRQFVEE